MTLDDKKLQIATQRGIISTLNVFNISRVARADRGVRTIVLPSKTSLILVYIKNAI